MWSVENPVEESVVKNVNWIYTQNNLKKCELIQIVDPQMFLNVYRYLGHLLGFPRPYYYY